MSVFITQLIVIIILAFVIVYLLKYNKSLTLEKRLAKYSIDAVNDNTVSFLDIMYKFYKLKKNNRK